MDYELDESFSITDDKLADWALRKIKEEEAERDRLINIANDQIADLNNRINQLETQCENKTKFLKGHLSIYFSTVPHKETKTQESYKLLSGSLVMKKATTKILHNDDELVAYLEANEEFDFIKIKKSPDWAEFKKDLAINEEGMVFDKITGEVLDSNICYTEDVPASFDIKF